MRYFGNNTSDCANCGHRISKHGDSGWTHTLTGRAICPTVTYASPTLA